MQAGIIGVAESGQLGRVESDLKTKEEYGMEFQQVLDVERVQDLSGETQFVEGAGLLETHEEIDAVEVEDGSIRYREKRRKEQSFADFVAVEARADHDGFAAVSSSDAEFIFDVIGSLSPGTRMTRADIRLGDWLSDRPDFNLEGGGSSGISSSNADTVMTWGQAVDEDTAVGRYIDDGKRANAVPVASGSYVWDSYAISCMIAASGWVQIWSPELSTYEWLEWVEQEILPYVEQL